MSKTKATQVEQARKALEGFVVQNLDVERLQSLLDLLNIFEAIGLVRWGLRHSDFLALLLDPQSNHNLDDWFIKRLLQRVLTTTGFASVSVTPIDLVVRDMIIKNKIGTGEHSDQLSRYHPPASIILAGAWLGCA